MFKAKGYVRTRALDPFYSKMMAKAKARGWLDLSKDDWIISGSDFFRTSKIERNVSEWLRHLGWETHKTNHALRAYSGSMIAMRYDIYEAKAWLGHSTVKITEEYYSYFVKEFRPKNIEDVPVWWAPLETSTPILSIVAAA